jgi:predicted nucleic acid-binding protein
MFFEKKHWTMDKVHKHDSFKHIQKVSKVKLSLNFLQTLDFI